MKKPPYFGRALLMLMVVLPLLFQVAAIISAFLVFTLSNLSPHPTPALVVGILPVACGFLWCCFSAGQRAARRPFKTITTSSPSPEYAHAAFWIRYLPVVVAFAYTLIVALIALALPVPTEGAVFQPFVSVFWPAHFTSSFVVLIFGIMSVPSPWSFLAPPLCIYTAYAGGLAWGFRQRGVPATVTSGRWMAGVVLVAAMAMIVVRMEIMSAGFIRGAGDDSRYAEWAFNHRHRPFSENNTLVTIPPSSLSIDHDHPRLDGATALFPVYAAAVQAIYKNIDPERINQWVTTSTTPKAYDRLIAGEVDLIFVAQPSVEQRAAAETAGRPLRLTPIAKEAFVFFVHADNPVNGLTSDQIRAIYTKKIVNWSEVGGRDEKIIPFQRPQGSGSQTALERKVMRGEPIPAPLREEFAEGMGGVIQRVAVYRNSNEAIGYSFRVYATTLNRDDHVKLLAIDGVAPTRKNIRDGSYPYTVEVYAATAGEDERPSVAALRDWFLGDEGQHLIDLTGYVGLR